MSKQSSYQDYSYLNTVWKIYSCNQGMDLKYISRIFEVLHGSLERSKKLFILRFDLHQPEDTVDNKAVSKFQSNLFKKIERDIGSRKRNYLKSKRNKTLLWAREQLTSTPHYHCALILDGQLFCSPKRILKWIRHIWVNITNGSVPSIPHPFYILPNSDILMRQKVIYRLSYLAKLKGKQEPKVRHFGSGQLKPMCPDTWNPNFPDKNPVQNAHFDVLGEEWLAELQEPAYGEIIIGTEHTKQKISTYWVYQLLPEPLNFPLGALIIEASFDTENKPP